jgi:RNA polymerase subunit RPABC4/transcription elongation factor Spt4
MIDLQADSLLLGAAVYATIVIVAFWLALILWAYRDMKARSRDSLMRLLVALGVAVLNVPGLLVYLLLRPRETLAEAYERSLEEEALLQEIEEKPVCPTCGIRTQDAWQVCPSCHTKLKKPCINCSQMLELSWNICPYCASSQISQEANDWLDRAHQQYAPPASIPEAPPQLEPQNSAVRSDQVETLEFVDGDEY